jgi:putative sterol carrier protein
VVIKKLGGMNFFIHLFKTIIPMSHQKVFEQFKEKAENAIPLGGTLKFMVDENAVFIDGKGEQNTVSMDDLEADCTITVSTEVLEKLRDGELNPMMAVMGGQVKIDGDMGLAMKVQSLMG